MKKKPESEIRSAARSAKGRPRFKKWADAMARDDDHSLAHWLEKMIQAEHERREAKRQTRKAAERARISLDILDYRLQPVGWVEPLRNPSLSRTDQRMGSLRST